MVRRQEAPRPRAEWCMARVMALFAMCLLWTQGLASRGCQGWDEARVLRFGESPFADMLALMSHGDPTEFEVLFPRLEQPANATSGAHWEGLGMSLSPTLRVIGFTRKSDGSLLPAEASGMIHIGDTLVAVNGIRINSPPQLGQVDSPANESADVSTAHSDGRHRPFSFQPSELHDAQSRIRAAAMGSLAPVLTFYPKLAPLRELALPDDYSVVFDGSKPLGIVVDSLLYVMHVLDGRIWPGGDPDEPWARDLPQDEGLGFPSNLHRILRLLSENRHPSLSQAALVNQISPGDRIIGLDGVSLLQLPPSTAREALHKAFRPALETQARKLVCRSSGSAASSRCREEPVLTPPTRRVVTFRPRVDPSAKRFQPYVRGSSEAFQPPSQAWQAPNVRAAPVNGLQYIPSSKLSCGLRGCSFGLPRGYLRLITRADVAQWRVERVDPTKLPPELVHPVGAENQVVALPHPPPRGEVVVEFRSALFGGRFHCRARPVVVAVPIDACTRLRNRNRVAGAVLLARRGKCQFAMKASHAVAAGASALVVMDNEPGYPVAMPAPSALFGPAVAELSQLASAMIDYHSAEAVLRALELATTSHYLAQFATDPDPLADLCLPERQALLASPPSDDTGRVPTRHLPVSVLGSRQEPDWGNAHDALSTVTESASVIREERSATDSFVASWKRSHERPPDPPLE
jgi:hypothetical protein